MYLWNKRICKEPATYFLIQAFPIYTFLNFQEKENSIFILIFNKAAAINYFEHLFRSPLTCTQYNEFIYTPLRSSLMHTIVIILLNAYTIYFLLNWYSTNFLGLFMAEYIFLRSLHKMYHVHVPQQFLISKFLIF